MRWCPPCSKSAARAVPSCEKLLETHGVHAHKAKVIPKFPPLCGVEGSCLRSNTSVKTKEFIRISYNKKRDLKTAKYIGRMMKVIIKWKKLATKSQTLRKYEKWDFDLSNGPQMPLKRGISRCILFPPLPKAAQDQNRHGVLTENCQRSEICRPRTSHKQKHNHMLWASSICPECNNRAATHCPRRKKISSEHGKWSFWLGDAPTHTCEAQ